MINSFRLQVFALFIVAIVAYVALVTYGTSAISNMPMVELDKIVEFITSVINGLLSI